MQRELKEGETSLAAEKKEEVLKDLASRKPSKLIGFSKTLKGGAKVFAARVENANNKSGWYFKFLSKKSPETKKRFSKTISLSNAGTFALLKVIFHGMSEEELFNLTQFIHELMEEKELCLLKQRVTPATNDTRIETEKEEKGKKGTNGGGR